MQIAIVAERTLRLGPRHVLSVGLHVVFAVAFIMCAVALGAGLAAFCLDAICDTTSVRQ